VKGNVVLDGLSLECRDFLSGLVMTKEIRAGEVIMDAGSPLHNLIFLHDGLVSMRVEVEQNRFVEAFSMGRDGVIGGQFLIGATHFPWRAVTVISGRASWLPARDFAEAMQRFPCVEPAIHACMARVVARVTQRVACTAVHSACQRIAVWLLLAHDRMQGKSFDITQGTIADIFGLRPATVSECCSRLQSEGAIEYSRGTLRVLDVDLLRHEACSCYETVSLTNLLSAAPQGHSTLQGTYEKQAKAS
jgi:CRP-like cAMP-binding protein